MIYLKWIPSEYSNDNSNNRWRISNKKEFDDVLNINYDLTQSNIKEICKCRYRKSIYYYEIIAWSNFVEKARMDKESNFLEIIKEVRNQIIDSIFDNFDQ